MPDVTQSMTDRAAAVRCLSALIDRSPGEPFLRAAARSDAPGWLRDAVESDRGDRPLRELADWLAAEHTRLFDTPHASLPPREGLRRGDGELLGPRCRAVQAAYSDVGFETDPACGRLPDHLSVELAFLALLLEQEDRTGAAQFVRRHLLEWVPDWVEAVLEMSPPALYRAVLVALGEVVHEEFD